ncbi:MAG: hypothetical protein SF052_09545 [Bacteroidia bacterium]|nr:hypothetical protein [Bacteroidia bacterium]
MNILRSFFFLFITTLTLTACRLNPTENLEWDADFLTPIAYASTGITDLVQDTTLLSVGQDNLISIVVRDTVASAALKDFVEFPDTTVILGVKLDTLTLASDTISQTLTLADLARQLIANGDVTTGTILLQNHGNTVPIIPGTPGLNSGLIEIDASDFFEFAELQEGELILSIINEFPLNLTNVIVEVKNKNLPGPQIVSDTFPIIYKNSSVTESYDLAGKQIESALEGQLANLDVETGFFVPIDTNDFIRITLVAQNLKAKTATAVFPPQTIIDSTRTTEYRFGGEFADIELTKIVVKSGKIRASTISTVEDTIRFQYILPAAVNSLGQVPSVDIKLNPAPPGGITTQIVERDLGGFTIDLTAGGTAYNTFEEKIRVDLLESGKIVTLDQTDSIQVEFGLVEIEPTYIEGYIGKEVFRFRGTREIDVFETLDVKKLKFTEPSATIIFASSVGVDAQVEVNTFTAINKSTGAETPLSGTALVTGPLEVAGAELPDTTETVFTAVSFDTENSNIATFVNLLANELKYDLKVTTNHNGNPALHNNFASDKSQIAAYVDFQLPLAGVLEELILTDTTELNLRDIDLAEIEGGTLRILLENEFPLQATVTARIFDEDYRLLSTLTENQLLNPGTVDLSGYVTVPGETTIEKSFTLEELESIIQEGKYLALHYSMSTKPTGTSVKLYADYRINAKLVGQFTYRLRN